MYSLINIETDWKVPPACSDRLNEVHHYWRTSRGKHTRPSRSDIRPADIVPIIRHVFLVDVEADGEFRCRLAGSHFTENTGLAMTGSPIAAIFPDLFCREVREAWSYCARHAAPTLGRGRSWVPARDFLDWEGIVLPLSEPDRPVNMLFGAIEFRSRLQI